MDDKRVAVLLEDLMSQFRTFGEGLQMLNEKMDAHIEENRKEFNALQQELIHLKVENRQEHQQLRQMVADLDTDIQRLDTEVVQIKRVK